VRTSRHAWWLAGVVAGVAGLATSYFVAMVMTIRESPVVAVAEMVIRLTPGQVVERAISILGTNDKPFLVVVLLVLLILLFAWAGRLARRSWWQPVALLAAIAILAGFAISDQRGARATDLLPVVVGFVTWVLCLSILTESLRSDERKAERRAEAAGTAEQDDVGGPPRRGFLLGAGLMVLASVGVTVLGGVLGRGRRQVEESRRLLRLPGVTRPHPPAGVSVGLDGIAPWRTPNDDFYLVHTALIPPAIEPKNWRLRIHGKVERELVLTYDDLMARQFTEEWVTLNCVSNTVGGNLIGNAWWSGVRVADLLSEVGVLDGADAVLQTSDDGWTCGTPLTALTDGRNAMLTVAMNGDPLPIEHGFPVRTLVPGLYGYVSACKWVVDWEVTTFEDISAYWTQRGWAELGPVKMSSRIDVPSNGDELSAGSVRIGGVAWRQNIGINGVEVSLDGGGWQSVEIGEVDTIDSWVQWTTTLDVEEGEHSLRVRAIDNDGEVQTGVVADVLPDGASGWHEVGFKAT
jgi:DMSO/TMAO reductase YedYZ molybdopterin-dependent catalytic subunit